jgi:hypothetical protein
VGDHYIRDALSLWRIEITLAPCLGDGWLRRSG